MIYSCWLARTEKYAYSNSIVIRYKAMIQVIGLQMSNEASWICQSDNSDVCIHSAKSIERVKKKSCTHADSNRRPFACKANVITDYTMRALTDFWAQKYVQPNKIHPRYWSWGTQSTRSFACILNHSHLDTMWCDGILLNLHRSPHIYILFRGVINKTINIDLLVVLQQSQYLFCIARYLLGDRLTKS